MARQQIESGIQRAVVQYFKSVVPNCVVMAIPNGSQRTASGRPANAVPGFLPGAPDLVVALSHGRTLWIEVKSPKGRTSDNQILVHGLLNAAGHSCIVVRSVDDVRHALKYLNVQTKESNNQEN